MVIVDLGPGQGVAVALGVGVAVATSVGVGVCALVIAAPATSAASARNTRDKTPKSSRGLTQEAGELALTMGTPLERPGPNR